MNGEWSLDVLYKGYDDPAFAEDMKRLDECIRQIKELAAELKESGTKKELSGKEAVLEVIRLEEEYSLLARKLSAFARLKHSTNTTDAETVKYQNLLRQKETEVSKEYVIMNKFLAMSQIWKRIWPRTRSFPPIALC